MKEIKGNSPKNARIKIDYSKNKPKVTFSYPCKKYQTSGSMFFYLFILFFILFIIGYAINELSMVKFNLKDAINFNYSYYIYNDSNLYKWTECYKQNSNYSFQELYKNICKDKITENNIGIITGIKELIVGKKNNFLASVLVAYLVASLIYLPFRKYWKNVYPKFQGFTARKKITRLVSKDIKFDEEYYCEIPVFNNIVLDYNATQDFSKYLELFEIREHKFKYYFKRHRRKIKLSKKQKQRRKHRGFNEYVWYARFYFKEKPKKGYIEVIYK